MNTYSVTVYDLFTTSEYTTQCIASNSEEAEKKAKKEAIRYFNTMPMGFNLPSRKVIITKFNLITK